MAIPRAVRNADIAETTARAVQHWAPAVSALLAEMLAPHLEPGETLPDSELFQKLVGRFLAARQHELETKDQQMLQATGLACHYRVERDQAARELREVLRAVRFFLNQTRGRGAGAKAGIGSGLSTMRPFDLARTGDHIARLLAEPKMDFEEEPSLLPVAPLTAAVREKTRKLEEVLGRLRSQDGDELHTRASLERSTIDAEKILRRAAALLAGFYKFVKHDRLAKAVRPVFRRRKKAKPPTAVVLALPLRPILAEMIRPGDKETLAILPPGLQSRLLQLIELRVSGGALPLPAGDDEEIRLLPVPTKEEDSPP